MIFGRGTPEKFGPTPEPPAETGLPQEGTEIPKEPESQTEEHTQSSESQKNEEDIDINLLPQEPEPEIELHPEEGEIEIGIPVSEKLAQEMLLTIQHLYDTEHQKFLDKRDRDEIAKLLNPVRIKTEREEQRIDGLVAEKIRLRQATNRKEALAILFNEHIYGPPTVQQFARIIRGLTKEKPGGKPGKSDKTPEINSADLPFLKEKFRSRREHEEGVAQGIQPHWRRETPPTKQERKRAEAERNKMDRFLTELSKLRG